MSNYPIMIRYIGFLAPRISGPGSAIDWIKDSKRYTTKKLLIFAFQVSSLLSKVAFKTSRLSRISANHTPTPTILKHQKNVILRWSDVSSGVSVPSN